MAKIDTDCSESQLCKLAVEGAA